MAVRRELPDLRRRAPAIQGKENGRRKGSRAHRLQSGFAARYCRVRNTPQAPSTEHVPELIDFGEFEGQAYDLTELIDGGSLSDMSVSPSDTKAIECIAKELGAALAAFMEAGLRHRALHPEKVLVRSLAPLDLVITGFESGRLSDADLETASLLDVSRYTAPEAVMGAVTSASDWWGSG